jgi:heat shock protein HtpX
MIRASVFLIAMATIFGAIGSLFGVQGAAYAAALSVVIAFWGFWSTPSKLAAIGAVEVTDPKMIALVHELSARARIPAPRVFEMHERQPNALALGPNPQQAVLVMTTGLRKRLSRAELAAVLGHELAHIRYRDTLVATIGMTFLTAIASLALFVGLIGLLVGRNSGGLIIGLAILAPLTGLVVHTAMSRSNEYRADQFGADLSGDPKHLISALLKLDSAAKRVRNSTVLNRPVLTPLFVVDPTPGSWINALFSTHPPIERRIARLEAMRSSAIGSTNLGRIAPN